MSSCRISMHTKNCIITQIYTNPEHLDSPSINRKTLLSFPIKRIRASMTVEAALALPIFLFFVVNLLSIFTVYERYSKNLATLHEQARNIAVTAHSYSNGNDMVDLYKIQEMSPLYSYMGFKKAYTSAEIHARKWTGYNVMSTNPVKEDEEYVYITESGTSYHRSRDCSHLKISVHVVKAKDVSIKRNDYGQRYRPCEKCGHTSSTGLVFVTDKGDRYHNSASCSGLKRTVLTVPLSQVGSRSPCSICGGE